MRMGQAVIAGICVIKPWALAIPWISTASRLGSPADEKKSLVLMSIPKSAAARLWTKMIPDLVSRAGSASQRLPDASWLIVATIAARAHREYFILSERC